MPQLGLETVNKFAKELITDNDTNLVVTDFAQEKRRQDISHRG